MMEDRTKGIDYFGEYRVIRKIGCGGFGCVHVCQHPRLGRQVAVKVFIGNVESEKEYHDFRREAHILEELEHSCIVSLLDIGIKKSPLTKNMPYLVMEFASHGSLRDQFEQRQRPFSFEETLPVLLRIGEALQYAHNKQIIHHDVKPENILFNQHQEALLADFGIAIVLASSSTKRGDRSGTATYMAPEQFYGKSHRRSDQYALACVAYEMLCGKPPFEAESSEALMYHHLHTTPIALRQLVAGIPRHVDQAILKALAKDRHNRYENVTAFLQALQARPAERVFPAAIITNDDFLPPRHSPHRRVRPALPEFLDDGLEALDDFPPRRVRRQRHPESWVPEPFQPLERSDQLRDIPPRLPREADRPANRRDMLVDEPQHVPLKAGRQRYAPMRPLPRPQAAQRPVLRRSRDGEVIGVMLCCLALSLFGRLFTGHAGFFSWLFYGGLLCGSVYSICLGVRCFLVRELGWGFLFALCIVLGFFALLFSLPLFFVFLFPFLGSFCYGWFHSPLRPIASSRREKR